MERIEGQLDEQKTLAKDALSWIVCARRPLETLELQHALAVERGTTELDEDNITELEDIVSVCAGLVTIDEESGVIRLVHYTTQEYFERTAEQWLPSAQHLIVESFMTYLSFNTFSQGISHDDLDLRRRLESYPLFEYATLEWGHHAKSISPPSEDLISFLMGSQANIEAAFEVVRARYRLPMYELHHSPQRRPSGLSGLHLAAYFGLKEAFIMVLERSRKVVDINARDDDEFTPLFYAVMGGKADFISWLLSFDEVEADLKSSKFKSYTPVHIAATMGNVVGILPFIESDKADLDLEDSWGQTPLEKAARGGYVEIVKALVESDRVCVNSPARTPLTHAAGKGRIEVVKFLLGTGKVNANEANKFGETPLNNALYSGTADTARCLLDSGQVDASLSVEGFLGKTPLERALQNFGLHDFITELILDRMEAIGISTEARTHAWEVCQQHPYAGVYNFY
ncbi:ankyrin repeat protein [Colletotrichum chrysophilum]|uniref:Ankyrin repeat protein n=1 Tax=Colletotrichum chrysophilum TaxID=1836956 RepID=A0AAD9EB60_9PEZI|nr:ankyrin repeat protein [Colletotrichum chrysophilum]